MKTDAQTFKHSKYALVAAVSSVLIGAWLFTIGIAIAFKESRCVIIQMCGKLALVCPFLANMVSDAILVRYSKLRIRPSLFLVSILKGASLFTPVAGFLLVHDVTWTVWVPISTLGVIYLANLAILNRDNGGASWLLIIHIAVTSYLFSLEE